MWCSILITGAKMSQVFPWTNKGCNVTCAFLLSRWRHLGWIISTGNNSSSAPEKAAFQAAYDSSFFLSFFFHVGMPTQPSQRGGSDKVAVRWLHQKPLTCSHRPHKWRRMRSWGSKEGCEREGRWRMSLMSSLTVTCGHESEVWKATTQRMSPTSACV